MAIERSKGEEYKSPFESLQEQKAVSYFSEMVFDMKFTGPVSRLLGELSDSLEHADKSDIAETVALHPPRIIRAAVDWKIAHPGKESEKLVEQSITMGLGVYQGRADAKELVADFDERLASTEPELLAKKVEQNIDSITWMAHDPKLSYKTAKDLAEKANGEDIVFVAIGHGGTAPGMDVYSKYTDIIESEDSSFYVVRYSANKQLDKQPQLTESEAEKLRELSEGKIIVAFDEDVTTGGTLNRVKSSFESTVLPGSEIHTITNHDPRGTL